MRTSITICDICGKETKDYVEYFAMRDCTSSDIKRLDVCYDCNKMFYLFANAIPTAREKAMEVLKGVSDEEG